MSTRARAGIHPAAWIAWIGGASLVTFTTTDPVYLLLLWATAWFVYQTHRVDGPTARSFRLFAIAGVVAVLLRTALVLFTPVGSRDVAFAVLEGLRLGTLLVLFGTFNAVDRSVRAGSPGAASTSTSRRSPRRWPCRSRRAPWRASGASVRRSGCAG